MMEGLAPSPISQALAAGAVARRLATRGDVRSAVGLLCQAVQLAPEAPILTGAESWLTAESLRVLGPRPLRKLALALANLAIGISRSGMGGNGRLLNLRAGLKLLGRGRACYPQEGKLYVGEAFVRHKLGDVDGKSLIAREAEQRFPSYWAGHRVLRALIARSQPAVATASSAR
jgi:hypothetical protein